MCFQMTKNVGIRIKSLNLQMYPKCETVKVHLNQLMNSPDDYCSLFKWLDFFMMIVISHEWRDGVRYHNKSSNLLQIRPVHDTDEMKYKEIFRRVWETITLKNRRNNALINYIFFHVLFAKWNTFLRPTDKWTIYIRFE